MYDKAGAPLIECLAPLLSDICAGMLYLHSRNIVHGGRHGGSSPGPEGHSGPGSRS